MAMNLTKFVEIFDKIINEIFDTSMESEIKETILLMNWDQPGKEIKEIGEIINQVERKLDITDAKIKELTPYKSVEQYIHHVLSDLSSNLPYNILVEHTGEIGTMFPKKFDTWRMQKIRFGDFTLNYIADRYDVWNDVTKEYIGRGDTLGEAMDVARLWIKEHGKTKSTKKSSMSEDIIERLKINASKPVETELDKLSGKYRPAHGPSDALINDLEILHKAEKLESLGLDLLEIYRNRVVEIKDSTVGKRYEKAQYMINYLENAMKNLLETIKSGSQEELSPETKLRMFLIQYYVQKMVEPALLDMFGRPWSTHDALSKYQIESSHGGLSYYQYRMGLYLYILGYLPSEIDEMVAEKDPGFLDYQGDIGSLNEELKRVKKAYEQFVAEGNLNLPLDSHAMRLKELVSTHPVGKKESSKKLPKNERNIDYKGYIIHPATDVLSGLETWQIFDSNGNEVPQKLSSLLEQSLEQAKIWIDAQEKLEQLNFTELIVLFDNALEMIRKPDQRELFWEHAKVDLISANGRSVKSSNKAIKIQIGFSVNDIQPNEIPLLAEDLSTKYNGSWKLDHVDEFADMGIVAAWFNRIDNTLISIPNLAELVAIFNGTLAKLEMITSGIEPAKSKIAFNTTRENKVGDWIDIKDDAPGILLAMRSDEPRFLLLSFNYEANYKVMLEEEESSNIIGIATKWGGTNLGTFEEVAKDIGVINDVVIDLTSYNIIINSPEIIDLWKNGTSLKDINKMVEAKIAPGPFISVVSKKGEIKSGKSKAKKVKAEKPKAEANSPFEKALMERGQVAMGSGKTSDLYSNALALEDEESYLRGMVKGNLIQLDYYEKDAITPKYWIEILVEDKPFTTDKITKSYDVQLSHGTGCGSYNGSGNREGVVKKGKLCKHIIFALLHLADDPKSSKFLREVSPNNEPIDASMVNKIKQSIINKPSTLYLTQEHLESKASTKLSKEVIETKPTITTAGDDVTKEKILDALNLAGEMTLEEVAEMTGTSLDEARRILKIMIGEETVKFDTISKSYIPFFLLDKRR